MIQPDRFQHSRSHSSLLEYLSSSVDHDEFINYREELMKVFLNNHHFHEVGPFSPPVTTTTDENNSLETLPTDIVINFPAISSQYLENQSNFPFHVKQSTVSPFTFPHDNVNSCIDNLEDINSMEIDHDMREWFTVDDDDQVPSMDVASINPSLVLPTEDMELENQLGSNHLAKAYTEAIDNGHRGLSEVIARRINGKVSPAGGARERLLYHSFHALDKQADGYIKHETGMVFHAAFEAIYRIFPYGMFAHFIANSAILEAMPRDTEVLHIVDFDIGEGAQWSSLIVALAQQQKLQIQQQQQHSFVYFPQQMTLKITSIKWKEENCIDSMHPTNSSHDVHSQWGFEETKRRLQDYANFHGLKLRIEEIELEDLTSEIKRRNRKREWLAFNCMWALPHMGRRRSKRRAMEFLKAAATGVLADSQDVFRGIVTYGYGDNWERIMKDSSCFGSFFESYMKHYQTLLESMERSLLPLLAEARIAMESLFVAPYVSSQGLQDLWREMEENELVSCGFSQLLPAGLGLKVSSERLMEAKVMVVREGEGMYGVRIIEGENNSNEMVLEWRGAPLVRVSAWGP